MNRPINNVRTVRTITVRSYQSAASYNNFNTVYSQRKKMDNNFENKNSSENNLQKENNFRKKQKSSSSIQS